MILDGKKVAEKILNEVKNKVQAMSIKPHLAVILVGNDPASKIYVRNKQKAAEKVGIASTIIEYPDDVQEFELLNKIDELKEFLASLTDFEVSYMSVGDGIALLKPIRKE